MTFFLSDVNKTITQAHKNPASVLELCDKKYRSSCNLTPGQAKDIVLSLASFYLFILLGNLHHS